jgi:hypothetical protein
MFQSGRLVRVASVEQSDRRDSEAVELLRLCNAQHQGLGLHGSDNVKSGYQIPSHRIPMPSKKRPHELIRDLVVERASRSDADVIAEIQQLPALADEGDPVWKDESYWSDFAYRYVALSDVAADRRLRPAVRLLLERACNGDPGEMMRGLRHASERTFNPDWTALADVCIELCASKRTGTRLWAMHQLMILDDPRARRVFNNALHDDIEEIRQIATDGLQRLDRKSQ